MQETELRQFRTDRQVTLKALAIASGIPYFSISGIERGHHTLTQKMFQRIATGYEILGFAKARVVLLEIYQRGNPPLVKPDRKRTNELIKEDFLSYKHRMN